jgi:hypothetical protein
MNGESGDQYYLFDHRILEEVENAVLSLGEVMKDPRNPLFVADRPWEAWLDNLYGNILYDEEESIFRLWYSPFLYHEFVPGGKLNEEGKHESGLCYAYSKDGIEWIKPELGIVDFEGSVKNNLVMRKVHGVGVFKDAHEADPAKRYKLFYKKRRDSRAPEDYRIPAGTAHSPDGIHWTEDVHVDLPCWFWKWGDTHNNCFWDERLRRYVLYTRTFTETPGERIRLVARMESQDFKSWSRPVDILRELPAEMGHRQVYTVPSFQCDGITMGFPMMFNTDEGDWTVDCELGWSPDTWNWFRICPGDPIIPRGPAGSFDFGTIYAAQGPIFRDEEILIYYGGFERPHRGYRKGSLCLARLRLDRWAGYEPRDDNSPCMITTTPIRWTGKRLHVSADCGEGGFLKAAAVGIEGRSFGDCKPLSGEVTRRPIEWSNDANLPPLEGETVRLQFQLSRAKLYAFGFGR